MFPLGDFSESFKFRIHSRLEGIKKDTGKRKHMFGPKIKLTPELYKRAKARAEELGYSDVTEYVEHLLEKDLAPLSKEEEGLLEERLKGLGYM